MTTPGAQSCSSPTVLFVGGIGRSGTTLLERSLGTTPSVVCLGEVTHLWARSLIRNELCGCGKAFMSCDFWRAVGQEAFGGWDQLDVQRVISLRQRIDRTLNTPRLVVGPWGGKWNEGVAEYASYYARIYRSAAKVSGAQVVVDSSKQASLPFVLSTVQDLDVRVLHCVRDSRAVAYSWTKTVVRPEGSGGDAQMPTYSPGFIAFEWLLQNLALEGLRLTKTRKIRVRYEDWVRQPDMALARILDFIEVPVGARVKVHEGWVALEENHTCSGNPMRFKRGKTEIVSDERWRTESPALQQAVVAALTSPMMLAYGYGRRRV